MADTERTLTELAIILSDNTAGAITPQDIRDLLVSVGNGKTQQNSSGWKDNVMPLSVSGVPAQSSASVQPFGLSGSRKELAFGINDYCFIRAIHVNHDIEVNGEAYIHVHWSTNGTDTNPVKWQFEVLRALGHQQAAFGDPVYINVQQDAFGTAWWHMIAEFDVADALTLTEPDELILITLRRITNGAVENTDDVFGVTVDIHYRSDRDSTLNKAPNFYE